MESPLLSVLIIAYNHASYIEQTILGALAQKTSFDFEIVVGDDASPDGTQAIIRKYAKEHPGKIRPFCYEVNQGLMGKYNFTKTLSECRGKYVALVEGDDYWTDPNKLEEQVLFLESNPDYSFSFHQVDIITEGQFDYDHRIYAEAVQDATTSDILGAHFIPTLSLVFHKKYVDPLPDFYWKVPSGDIVIELVLSLFGKARYFPKSMGVYRNHSQGITKTEPNWSLDTLIGYLNLYHEFDKHAKGVHHEQINGLLKQKLIASLATNNRQYRGWTRAWNQLMICRQGFKFLDTRSFSQKKDILYSLLIPRLYQRLRPTGD
ncbi:MAG: glycosyltransferase [Bacteroidota bacterium]